MISSDDHGGTTLDGFHVKLADARTGWIRKDLVRKDDGCLPDRREVLLTPPILHMSDGSGAPGPRGKVVVEEDLAEALKSGKVRAYATDVYYSDPPDPSSPLLTAPNVVMTPHIGGSSNENLLRIGDNVVDILKKWKR